jgi:acyl-coenzyme A thioesterase PaaI-like protein
VGRGRIVRKGCDVGFMSGELVDSDGEVVAVATATAQIRRPPLS